MIRKEQVRNQILKILGENELHGYDIHKLLEERGMKIRIGRLYEVLNQMSSEGLLKDRWLPSPSGPKKRMYRISAKGRNTRETILQDAIQTVHEFYGEYLRTLPKEKGAFHIISEQLLKDLGDTPAIAFVSMRSSRSIKELLTTILQKAPKASLYFVGPREIADEMELVSIPYLEGTCNSVPSKDDYFDLLVLPGFSGFDSISDCVKEWRRVLNSTGKVGIVSPTTLIRRVEDPMSIGEFLEQKEHPSELEEEDVSPEELISAELKKHFKRVKQYAVVHVSVILGEKSLD